MNVWVKLLSLGWTYKDAIQDYKTFQLPVSAACENPVYVLLVWILGPFEDEWRWDNKPPNNIDAYPNFPQISRHGARLRKNSKRSKTSCGGSFKPVNQFTSLAYQEYHGESRRYPKRSKDFKMRRICFTMERQWQLLYTVRAKQHCRWHLEENSCTSLYRVRFKEF